MQAFIIGGCCRDISVLGYGFLCSFLESSKRAISILSWILGFVSKITGISDFVGFEIFFA